jgi:nitrogen fixation protein FixH
MTITTTNIATDNDIANRRAARRWGAFVIGLLSLQVIGGAFAIFLATGDESVAVVPNYHQQALDWDQQVAIRNASAKLGWVAEMSQLDAQAGSAGLRISLRDRDGQIVEIQSGTLEIYRHVRAGNVRRVAIPSGAPEAIDLSHCFDASGLWQVTFDVSDAAGNRFVDSQELDVRLPASDVAAQGTR